ncbi:MAG: redoxin domain-containing protein, partial [Helicobacter sp.]|nr:redoxin domain-containing protein [Helicobacter sp.]
MEIQLYDDAPLFTLPNQDNAEISLKDFRGSYVI